jgi:Fe-S-cluster-containing dehydrogenase component
MQTDISRRQFFKKGALAAAVLAVSNVPQVRASERETDLQLATLIDVSRCIGCEACVDACKQSNDAKFPRPVKPFPKMVPARVKVEDWSEKKDVRNRLTPYNWLFIQRAVVQTDDGEKEITLPRCCMHCVNSPCVKLGPWGAAIQQKNGISRMDPDLRLGGAKCKNVCPWKIPQRQIGAGLYLDILPSLAGNGVMNKCDRCYDRIAEGKNPACIEACPEQVQTIGPRREILKQAHELASSMNGFIYGETENGGTNSIYVSPVPFETLNQAIDKGQGKPSLKKVKDEMSEANTLAAALVIAPFAGLASAIGRYYKTVKKHASGGPS